MITYRYVGKLGPGIEVMLVPADNPFLLPLPDLTSDLEVEPGGLLPDTPTVDITGTGVLTSTVVATPTVIP